MLDTIPLRTVIDGVEHWQYPDGRRLPIMAGAEEEGGGDDAAARAAADAEAAARADAERAAADRAAADAAAEDEPRRLGPKGEAALEAERKARRDAEKRAKAAEAEARRLRDATLSETERLKQEAEQGRQAAATATDKLRRANLITALSDHGINGANAKAAAKLLDSVEYDDDDEPTNLEDAIRTASEEYGPALFRGARRRAPATDGGAGGSGSGDGPTLTADEQRMARALGMSDEDYARHKTP